MSQFGWKITSLYSLTISAWQTYTTDTNTVKAMAYKRADKTIDSDYSNHGKKLHD